MELVWGSEAFLERAHKYVKSKEEKLQNVDINIKTKSDREELSMPNKVSENEIDSTDLKELPQPPSSSSHLRIGEESANIYHDIQNGIEQSDEIATDHSSTTNKTTTPAENKKDVLDNKYDIPIETFNVNDMINEIRKEFDNRGDSGDRKVQRSPGNQTKEEEEDDQELYQRIPPLL